MIRSVAVRLWLTPLAALVLVVAAHPGETGKQNKGATIPGKIAAQKIKMSKGSTYLFEVDGKGFAPRVIVGGNRMLLATTDFRSPNTLKVAFTAPETKAYTVVVVPDPFLELAADSSLEYTLKVRPLAPLLTMAGKLTDQDTKLPDRGTYFKSYPIKLKASQTYVINMQHAANDLKLDPYLYLKEGDRIIAQDDDSGGNLNAQITYVPAKDGEYTIVATTLRAATGDFTLTVHSFGESKAK
jgi:hypothetical protein